jgi:hypothetical protein
MKTELEIGTLLSGRKFCLPRDYQVHTTALRGM